MLVIVPRSSADNVTVSWMDVFVENENALELVHVSKKHKNHRIDFDQILLGRPK